MLHRLRVLCNRSDKLLNGMVEVDETYLGGKAANKHAHQKIKHSQGGANKGIIVDMKQRGGKVKAQVIPNTQSITLQTVLSNKVEQDTLLMTDELRSYKGVNFNKMRVNHSAKEVCKRYGSH